MRLLSLLFSFLLSSARGTPVDRLPIVEASQFAVGTTWTWSYEAQGDSREVYSTEQYRVVDLQKTVVTIEIWTRYAGKRDFTPSARFITDLNLCRHAFDGPYKKEVTIEMHPYDHGAWSKEGFEMEGTAFEEKFNCNPKIYLTPTLPFNTRFKESLTAWGEAELFQQSPRSTASQLEAFYFFNHPALRAVAFEKSFGKNSPNFYLMRLIGWSDK